MKKIKNYVDPQEWMENLIPGLKEGDLEAGIDVWKKITLIVLLLITFFGLFIRIFHLQIVEGSRSRSLADSNRIQIKIIHAPRGVIYDRYNNILARNEPGFRLVATDSSFPTTYISREEALKMELENDLKLKFLEVDNLRYYPIGEKLGHVLGYISEITQSELNLDIFKGYRIGDRIGRSGVEEKYERILKGVDGGEIIEVDSQNRKVRTISSAPAIPGSNLILTIDSPLQEITYESLKKGIEKSSSCCGGAITIEPKTGEVLSLVSIPSFDPNNISRALQESNSPFLNRVIAGSYPPGSTFKIVSALSGLSSGKITPQTSFEDIGVINIEEYKFANWYFSQYGKKEGMVNLTKALLRSNDTYFYYLANIIGEEAIAQTSRDLNLGKTLGIDLPGEGEGLIPDGVWKKKNVGEIWFPGDTLHMAIGQGFILTTPLQISGLISYIASGGILSIPHLVSKITTYDDKLVNEYTSQDLSKNKSDKKYSKEHIRLIKDALAQVPKPGGTAWPFFDFPIPTAGKTGTAEFGDPKGKTHAWYTSFAPVDDPKIALTVLVEAGGEGSSIAGGISKDIYKWYFNVDKNEPATKSAKLNLP